MGDGHVQFSRTDGSFQLTWDERKIPLGCRWGGNDRKLKRWIWQTTTQLDLFARHIANRFQRAAGVHQMLAAPLFLAHDNLQGIPTAPSVQGESTDRADGPPGDGKPSLPPTDRKSHGGSSKGAQVCDRASNGICRDVKQRAGIGIFAPFQDSDSERHPPQCRRSFAAVWEPFQESEVAMGSKRGWEAKVTTGRYACQPCRKCGAREAVELMQTFKDGSNHVRVECAQCGQYFRYVSRQELLNRECLANESILKGSFYDNRTFSNW